MEIAVDKKRCSKCGTCIKRMEGYCISSEGGFPVFDENLCNTCQKCVAICPSQAITVNGKYPRKIEKTGEIEIEKLEKLLAERRSVKRYADKEISKEIVERITAAAKFAPNQNKNISMVVIDDKKLIEKIDDYAVKFTKKVYDLLFGVKVVEKIISFFYKDIGVIKRKMEYNNFKNVVYDNTQILILLTGDKKIPVTERSAQYLLANMIITAEALGIGSCLMDSVYLTFKTSRKLRKELKINEDVLGVLALGYSAENIINVPEGYEINIRYNI